MKWYFWLNKTYNQIIYQYQKGYFHHAFIVNSIFDMGGDSLVWAISRWLLCKKTINLKSCNKCNGCKFMKLKIHPDWYKIEIKKENNFNIDDIYNLKEKIQKSSQQGGFKIIWFSNINQLTESLINSLLKIVEEPPNNSIFFFSCNNLLKLSYTLISRCMILNLLPPSESKSLLWLKKNISSDENDKTLLSTLRLNFGYPISALNMLTNNHFKYRKKLCEELLKCFDNNQISLLPIMNNEFANYYINWLLFLIIDAIKLKNKCSIKWIINYDYFNLIQLLSNKITNNGLFNIMDQLLICNNNLIYSSNINKEILIINNFLLLEELISVNFIN